VKSVHDLLADGCYECHETLLEPVEIFPVAISFALASDRGVWSRPRVVMLCNKCASEVEAQATPVPSTGSYFAE
jgi:hypothetical protein